MIILKVLVIFAFTDKRSMTKCQFQEFVSSSVVVGAFLAAFPSCYKGEQKIQIIKLAFTHVVQKIFDYLKDKCWKPKTLNPIIVFENTHSGD